MAIIQLNYLSKALLRTAMENAYAALNNCDD